MSHDPTLEALRAELRAHSDEAHLHATDLALLLRRASMREAAVDDTTRARVAALSAAFAGLMRETDSLRTALSIAGARGANDPAPPALRVIRGGRSL